MNGNWSSILMSKTLGNSAATALVAGLALGRIFAFTTIPALVSPKRFAKDQRFSMAAT